MSDLTGRRTSRRACGEHLRGSDGDHSRWKVVDGVHDHVVPVPAGPLPHLLFPTNHPPISEVLRLPVEPAPVINPVSYVLGCGAVVGQPSSTSCRLQVGFGLTVSGCHVRG